MPTFNASMSKTERGHEAFSARKRCVDKGLITVLSELESGHLKRTLISLSPLIATIVLIPLLSFIWDDVAAAERDEGKNSCGTLSLGPLDLNDHRRFKASTEKLLDATHRELTRSVNAFANRLDTFLANDRSLEEDVGNRLRLRLITRVDEDLKVTFKQRVSLHMELPKLTKRLMLVMEELGEGENLQDIKKEENIEDLDAVFRLLLREKENERLALETGMSFKPAPNPLVRLRYRYNMGFGRWNFRPTQWIYWKRDEGFGEKTRFDLEKYLFKDDLLRFTEEVVFSEESSGVEFLTAAGYMHALSEISACGLFFNIESHSRPYWEVTNYSLSFTYRRSIYKKWLFFQIEPVLDAPIEEGYRIVPSIYFVIEAVFS